MRVFRRNIRYVWAAVFIVIFSGLLVSQESKKKDPFEMSFQELMKVKIRTAGKIPEQIRSIPASVVLITRKDIETYGYRTLTEILENIPGLYGIEDYSGEGSYFGVRGFWSGQPNKNIIILVNGVSQIYDYQSTYPLVNSPIPVEAIDRLEVVRGPMSVIYGTGAFFGVINIITDDVSSGPVNVASLSVGSEKTKKLFLRMEGGEKGFQYAVNASYYDTYGLDEPIGKMTTNVEALSNYNIEPNHRTGGQLEESKKYFNFSGRFRDLYLDMTYNESEQEFYFPFPSYSEGIDARWNSTRVLLGYRRKVSDTFTIDGKLHYTQTRRWNKYDYIFEDFYGLQDIRSKAFTAELDAFVTVTSSLELKSGVYYRAVLDTDNMVDLPSFGNPFLKNKYVYLDGSGDIVTQAFYAQATYKPLANLELVAGLRLEQMPEYTLGQIVAGGEPQFTEIENVYNQDSVELIPRVALVYSFNDRNIVKLLYGKAINRPSFFQNTKNNLDPGRADLQPEWIQTMELNYTGALSPRVTLNANVFYNTLENLVTRIVEFDENRQYESWFDNAGKMVTKGVELTLQTRPFKGFTLDLSGTYQETDDKQQGFEDITVAYSPKFLGYLKASYRHKKWTVALTGTYVGEMETFWDETLANPDETFGGRIGETVPGYFNLGANLRAEDFLVKGLFVNLRVSNLLDQEIRYPTYTNNQWANRGTLGHRRFFMLSVGWKF